MTGGCLCGAIRYEATGEPIFSTHCHCRDCQRASGSAYVATARLPAAGFRITKGSPKRFVGKADSGNEVTRVFCGDCGSPLYSQVSARWDLIPRNHYMWALADCCAGVPSPRKVAVTLDHCVRSSPPKGLFGYSVA